MYEFGSLIGGAWQGGAAVFTTRNPASPETVEGQYLQSDPESVAYAVTAGAHAQKVWAEHPPAERSRILQLFLDSIEARADSIAEAVTREQGKPLAESRGEIGKSLREARFMAAEAIRGRSDVVPAQKPRCRNMVLRRPRGVIAAITPWNFPVLTPMRKIAPALTHGNAIVLKPSELTPAAACLIADAGREFLPPGLLQIVQGGGEVGEALVGNAGVHGVTFTGSVATGKSIYAAAADNLAELSLELGGKNAVIINDTGDLDRCLDQVVGAAFQCAGQRCTAISRVIVASELADAVVAGLKRRAEAFVLGAGSDADTTMGPLVNGAHLERVAGFVKRAVSAGVRVVTGGERATVAGCPNGYFYQPTVLTEVTSQMEIAREEVFGPVLTVTAYRDFAEALHILNDVEHGLTSSLFSNDSALIQRFLDESHNGMLHVNHGTIPDDHMPFGGIKNSGVGAYSVGPSVVQFYTTEHSAYVEYPAM